MKREGRNTCCNITRKPKQTAEKKDGLLTHPEDGFYPRNILNNRASNGRAQRSRQIYRNVSLYHEISPGVARPCPGPTPWQGCRNIRGFLLTLPTLSPPSFNSAPTIGLEAARDTSTGARLGTWFWKMLYMEHAKDSSMLHSFYTIKREVHACLLERCSRQRGCTSVADWNGQILLGF